eukprot:scaffold103639_cov67-Attheya_sp.AAC.3
MPSIDDSVESVVVEINFSIPGNTTWGRTDSRSGSRAKGYSGGILANALHRSGGSSIEGKLDSRIANP